MDKSIDKVWDYRVVRTTSKDGSDEWYSLQEVYYDGDENPMAMSTDLMVEGDTVTGLRTQLERMMTSLDQNVLDESDIVDSPEIRTSFAEDSLEGQSYIYESPDGGETLYRREIGSSDAEEKIQP